MAPFLVNPSPTMSFHTRGKRHRGHTTETRTDFANFVMAMFSLALALAYQQGEFHSNYGTQSSLFLGTAPVSAAVATTAMYNNVPRAGRPTTVTMAAGSSRTLIELANRDNNGSGEFLFEVTYLDENDESGLLVLRRANIDTSHQSKSIAMEGGRAVYKSVARVLKNPIVFFVLAGNIASMTGILPPGIAGFFPSLGIFLRKNMKWTAPVLGKLGSLQFGKAVLSKLKVNKLSKFISTLYKNRSKYSLLSDCLWYVDTDEKKNKNGNGNIDGGATASKYRAVA